MICDYYFKQSVTSLTLGKEADVTPVLVTVALRQV